VWDAREKMDTALAYFIKGWLLLVVALNLGACAAILSVPTIHDVYLILLGSWDIIGVLSPETSIPILVMELILVDREESRFQAGLI
jgi:hypothetical protein